MFKRLLVPLDGSRFSTRAVRYATEVAKHFDAEVVLIQAVLPATPVTATVTPGVESPVATEMAVKAAQEQDRRNVGRAKQYLARKVRDLKVQGIQASYKVVVGDPARSILDACHTEKSDLVVMTTHGKSGLKRALMGSVADEVIRQCGEPVLVVRPRERKKR